MARASLLKPIPDDPDDDDAPDQPPRTADSARCGSTHELCSQVSRDGGDSDAEAVSMNAGRTGSERRDEREVTGGNEREAHGERRSGTDIGKVPEGRRCGHVDALSPSPDKRCKGWTRKIAEGVFDRFCKSHSRDPRASERRRQELAAAAKASAMARSKSIAAPTTLIELLRGPVKTQDAVEAARLAAIIATVTGELAPQRAQVVLQGLKDVSQHIERYGAVAGSEGGHSYMRLMPGVILTEYQDPRDAILDADDIDRIDAGIAADVRAGVQVPADMADVIERYLGRQARRREKSRYDTGQN